VKGTLAILLTALMLVTSGVRAEESDQGSKIIRVGYSGQLFTETSLRDAQVAIELWTRQVAVGMERVIPQIVLFDDLEGMVRAVRAGEVDLLSISTLDYLRIRDHTALEPALASVSGIKAEQEYVLLVRRNREVGSLQALRGGRLMVEIGKRESSVSKLWLNSLLLKMGRETAERFFGGVKQVVKTSQAVLPVFFGQADAALVRKSAFETMTELNPQLERALTALITSPQLLPVLVCFSAGGSAEDKRALLVGAVILHRHPRGKQILTLFQVDKMIPFNSEMLVPVVGLLREYEALKQRSGGDK